jgi:hypothetical protein
MARRYSRVSNYRIGQSVRGIVFGMAGFVGCMWLLPRARPLMQPEQVALISIIVAVVAALFAKRYT